MTGPCVEAQGEPATLSKRTAGRPACRRARVLEWRDGDGTPRYGCVFAPRGYEQRKPLPLVLFFHDSDEDPTAVHRKTRLRARYGKLDMVGDERHQGFIILAPQARKLLRPSKRGKKGRLGSAHVYFDTDFMKSSNADVLATDHFVDELIAAGEVDPKRIYPIGHGRGGTMAALYAHLRPDRAAAFGVFGAAPSAVQWSCEGAGPPAAVLYRACDSATPCDQVESWLDRRREAGAATMAMRLGSGKATETHCAVGRCSDKKGAANHARWPKPREGELLDYLATFELDAIAR